MSTAELTDSTLVDLTVAEIRNRINQEYLTKQIDEFIEVIASDAFLDYVNGIAELPSHEQRREETARTASVTTLERVGVPTPEGLRLTTRAFETPEDGQAALTPLVRVQPALDPRMGFCVSLGFYLCVSYGG